MRLSSNSEYLADSPQNIIQSLLIIALCIHQTLSNAFLIYRL